MNAKEVALCSIFAAIAIALERVRIPAVFAQVQFYFWEIPIIIALLLFGLKVGFSIAAITAFGQALIFPRALGFLFPFWNLVAMSTFLVGIFLVQRLINHRANGVSGVSDVKHFRIKPVVWFIIAAMIFRLSMMPFVNFFMYKFLMPLVIGQIYSDVTIIAMIPSTMVFDAIFTLYTIPIAYMIAKKVNETLKIGNTIF
jgi:riboflavin transporter FmnP